MTESPNRNFAEVANRVISLVEYYSENYDINEEKKVRLFLIINIIKNLNTDSTISSRPHVVTKIYHRLNNLENDLKMEYNNYRKFVSLIEKIKRDGFYLPPDNHYILWEKLAKVCYIYLTKYQHTSWAEKISRVIRNLE